MAVDLDDVQSDLSFLLGESAVPSTGVEDRAAFIQRTLERVYRLHDFEMNKITATVAVVSGTATLAANLGQDSELDVRDGTTGQPYDQIPYEEQHNYVQGDYKYWLEGFEGTGTYLLKTKEANSTLKLRFTTSVPVINASISTPFPSSMALARGALVYYRQAEDPQADISQEEATFQQEVTEVWARQRRSAPQQRAKDLYEASGTYVGDTTTIGTP